MFDLAAVQEAIHQLGFDGWLLYDFRGLNILARRVLGLNSQHFQSRRWFYFIPAKGEPKKLVHRIESGALDAYPGSKRIYLRWQELEAGVAELVKGSKKVAMEYVPRNANPYVSRVDAGTVELVKSNGIDVVPSGDLVQWFEACWDAEQEKMHFDAAVHTRSAYDVAFDFIRDRVKSGASLKESDVIGVILAHFERNGLETYHPPIVAVNEHSGDPHYETTPQTDAPIRQGDFVLIDLWAKLKKPRAVYSDLTRVCFVGKEVPAKHAEVFRIVAAGRDAGIDCVKKAFAENRVLQGWQVDDATRHVIEKAGYGEFFCHRTGHSIGQEVHGNGANMDNLETREERRVLPRTCFSIEPGIYLPEFGVRSEVDVYVDAKGTVHVTGGDPQLSVTALMA